jgi:hypothetical protein
MNVVRHDHVSADPDSVPDTLQRKLDERLVYSRSIQNPSAVIPASRKVIDRIFREEPSKPLRSGHTSIQEFVHPTRGSQNFTNAISSAPCPNRNHPMAAAIF